MSHEIDFSNRRANIAYTGAVPWHGLGSRLSPDARIEEWRREAGLNWSAEEAPVEFEPLGGSLQRVKGRKVLYRSDTHVPLSVVSSNYKPFQPADVLEFFRDVVEVYGVFKMETAGSLKGGRKIWALAKADNPIVLGREDQVDQYLLLATSFDKSLATTAMLTSVRVVCANTLGAAISSKNKAVRVLHTQTFDEKRAKSDLGIFVEQWDAFHHAIEGLSEAAMSREAARLYFDDVLHPEAARKSKQFTVKGAEKRVDQVMHLFYHGPGSNLTSARGTAWGAVNAVTHYYDHKVNARSPGNRLESAWFGKGADIKGRAMEKALTFAGVGASAD